MKKQKLFLAGIAFFAVVISVLGFATKDEQQKPKMYTVTMTDEQWIDTYSAINNPDDVSVNKKKIVLAIIAQQVNAQMKVDSTKKK